MEKGNLAKKFTTISEHWQPQVAASLNGQDMKLVKVQGTFPWHLHEATDEMFMVWRGRLRVELRNRAYDMGPGEFVVVPRLVEHRAIAESEAEILVIDAPEEEGASGTIYTPTTRRT